MDFVESFNVSLDLSTIYFAYFSGCCTSFIYSCYSILQCCKLFSREIHRSVSFIIIIVSSPGTRAVIPHLDMICYTNGFPEKVKTDGDPPFKISDSHKYITYWAGIKQNHCCHAKRPRGQCLSIKFHESNKRSGTSRKSREAPKTGNLYKLLCQY